jgi:MSHA biogenesis protein MshM
MYLEHFGLDEAPFRITPHVDFFFSGAKRGATLEALNYAILHDEGIVKVSGEVGSGKTMLCRVLMEQLPTHVVTLFLANPSLSRDDILFAIAEELQVPVAEHTRVSTVLRAVQEKLIALYGGGSQVVVLIDEAHTMPAETLEEIRLLSNLESNRHKLLQLVLFGQPELDATLARPDMRQLRERITQNFTLEPLVRADIAAYLDFRMRAAGYRGPEVFSAAAVKEIARASQGLTRRINILGDKALLAAFSDNLHQVTPLQVRAAIRDAQFAPPRWRRPAIWAGAGAIAAAVLALVATRWQGAAPDAPPAAAISPAATSVAPLPPSPATLPSAAEIVAPPPDVEEAAAARLGPLAQDRLEQTRRWLAGVPDEHWFVQLMVADGSDPGRIDAFLGRAGRLLDPAQVRVFVATVDNGSRIGVIYGDYPSRDAAAHVAASLPAAMSEWKPYPRQVRRLRRG